MLQVRGFLEQDKDTALDQGFLRHNSEPEPNDGASGIARKAKLVALVSAPEAADTKPKAESSRRRSIGQILALTLSLVIAAFSLYILGHVVSGVRLGALRQAITATGADQIFAALLFTILSYLALTGYDGLALRQLKATVPYKTTALASFTSYAISFTLGFPLITAGTVRYWIYSPTGLSAGKVASLTVIAGVTYWFGSVFVLGAGLAFHAGAISAINHFYVFFNVLLGVIVLGSVLAYLIWVTIHRRHINIKGFRLELPGLGLTLGQVILGVIDQSAAAGALYVLLPSHADLDYFTFAAIYVFACILGVASNAPGGIGVFEAAMLKAVPVDSASDLLASLVLFRVIYYLLPFFFALAVLGAHEGFGRWSGLREAMRTSEGEAALEDEINPLRRWYRDKWRPKP